MIKIVGYLICKPASLGNWIPISRTVYFTHDAARDAATVKQCQGTSGAVAMACTQEMLQSLEQEHGPFREHI